MTVDTGRLAGKRAIVTGGARGNGRAMALGLARAGARVALLDRDLTGARGVAEETDRAGGRATAHQCDVAVPAEVDRAVGEAVAAMGGLDVLVNNAGVEGRPASDTLAITLDEWDRVMHVNLRGAFYVAQVAARQMVHGGGGSIVNITSNLSFLAVQGNPHYIAAKGGLRLLTQAMAVDLAPHGIRVNAIAPGLMLTDMTRARYEGDPAWWAERDAHIPLKRIGQPDELAGAAIYLASDEASYVTGTTIAIDGGYTAR